MPTKKNYTPEIQNVVFHLPHIQIIGTNHCGNTSREALKHQLENQYLLRSCYYTKRVVASIVHQIKSE